ncbi:hypothetical protein [Streptococcus sp. DD12]|uniref:hypothetical protein n=1 Tax=Streptococcus sp. DD12 TaxID=1777880 RepID=UPI00082E5CAC|nr:hypothetical protein [Streptococcus sp. DD12]
MDRKSWIDDFTVLHGRKPTVAELQQGETQRLAPHQVAVADLAKKQSFASQSQGQALAGANPAINGTKPAVSNSRETAGAQMYQAGFSQSPFLASQPAVKKPKTLWNTQLTALGLLSRGAILILVAFVGYVVGYLFA